MWCVRDRGRSASLRESVPSLRGNQGKIPPVPANAPHFCGGLLFGRVLRLSAAPLAASSFHLFDVLCCLVWSVVVVGEGVICGGDENPLWDHARGAQSLRPPRPARRILVAPPIEIAHSLSLSFFTCISYKKKKKKKKKLIIFMTTLLLHHWWQGVSIRWKARSRQKKCHQTMERATNICQNWWLEKK